MATMFIGRVSTFAQHQALLQNVGAVQNNLAELQNQISSGLKTTNFLGLRGQIELFTGLEAKIKKSEMYIENNSVIASRLRTMNKSMELIIDAADDLQNLYTLRRNGALEDSINFEIQSREMLTTIVTQLNSSLEGRFLFAGSKTNQKPVADDPVPPPVEIGTLDAGYYQGDQVDLEVRPQDNFTFTYGIRADDEAFQKIIHSVFMAQAGDIDDDDGMIADAYDMVTEGIEQVIALRAEVDAELLQLENINSQHDALRLDFQAFTEDIARTDVVEAASKVAIDQAVLQASFQSFASLARLRLTDFL